jgi:hypothetical protein
VGADGHGAHQEWECPLAVGMPIRTKLRGHISPQLAAEMTADVATDASVVVMLSRPLWLAAAFCSAFYDKMNRMFVDRYEGLGARASARSPYP